MGKKETLAAKKIVAMVKEKTAATMEIAAMIETAATIGTMAVMVEALKVLREGGKIGAEKKNGNYGG